MQISEQEIQGCRVITCDRFQDNRGFFQEVFHDRKYGNVSSRWLQTNWSQSGKNVIRGIHTVPFPKLVTCIKGHILDIIVDLRATSKTYKQWAGIELSDDEPKQVYVPANCGHGFFSYEDDTHILYMQGGLYNPRLEKEISWRDPEIAIEWPEAESYILSEKDRNAPLLNEVLDVMT